METLLYYLLKANVVFTLLFLAYYVMLRREKFLNANRLLLLMIFAAAIILPLCPAFNYEGFLKSNVLLKGFKPLSQFYGGSGNSNPTTGHAGVVINYGLWLTVIYLAAVMFLLGRFIAHIARIIKVISKGAKQEIDGIWYCEPSTKISPFSFFKFIVIKSDAYADGEYQQVVLHELCHCRQLHSVDVLLAELACACMWINPLVFLYKRQVKLNLEFLADDAVLQSGIDCKSYQLNLLASLINSPANLFANSFHSSKIKQRVSMMNARPSPLLNRYKYAVLIPLLAVLYIITNPSQAKSHTVQQPSAFGRYFTVETNTDITIDARTDTVKIRLEPRKKGTEGFKGIYVVESKIYTDAELRNVLKPAGKLDIRLARRPIIGMFTPNDSNAIKEWGQRAAKGVIFIKTPAAKVSR